MMREWIGLDHVGLLADGPTLSMGIGVGQKVAIMGPASSGKSRLLRVLAGQERPSQGSVALAGQVQWISPGSLSRRSKPNGIAVKEKSVGPGSRRRSLSAATEALIATRLWEDRNRPISELGASQVAASELLPALLGDEPIVLLDGQLDVLDPWTLGSVREALERRLEAGACLVFSTQRPDLAEQCDVVLVLRGERVRFAGPVEELLRQGPPHVFTVTTENQSGVRALVDPFALRVDVTPAGLRIEAQEGQELAARLMLEGYGDVKTVVHRPPTLDEALRSLFA